MYITEEKLETGEGTIGLRAKSLANLSLFRNPPGFAGCVVVRDTARAGFAGSIGDEFNQLPRKG